eukprot:scaffold1354_cov111-Isochrysis_galbana.AAC.11
MVLEQEPRTRRAGKLSDAGQGFPGPAIPRGFQRLRKNICRIVNCGNVGDRDNAICDIFADFEMATCDVTRAVGNLALLGKLNRAGIVHLEHGGCRLPEAQITYDLAHTRRGVRGAKACARLSFRGRRVKRSGLMDFPASSAARSENGSQKGSTICGRVKMMVGNLMDWSVGRSDPGGCCSGQLFAVVVMGGAATPKGVFAALTTHAMSRSSGQ